jgi:hypothetical protein
MTPNASARRPSFGVAQDRLLKAAHEMKLHSNYANHLCHAGGEPREPVLTLTLSVAKGRGKDSVLGGRVFAARAYFSAFAFRTVLAHISLEAFCESSTKSVNSAE